MTTIIQARPARLGITNLQTGEEVLAQFNPTQLNRTLESSWQRHEVLGQSFQPLDYLNTRNGKLRFSLYFRAENRSQLREMTSAISFLESLQYPPSVGGSIRGRQPPRCLIVWPNSISVTAVMTSFDLTHEMFDLEGNTIQATATLEWEAARRGRITQEQVRSNGAMQPPEQTGDTA